MRRIRADLWHLEKALTATAVMAAAIVIAAGFIALGERLGWFAGGLFALGALSCCVWIIVRYVPLSEYRSCKR
jgi:hypothetical protein